ncbi:MAG: type II toxin-antitoxin system Phd/YefM family antitoxin [Armatimonadota bacterium]|jgi:prevent-host-death family protein
MRLCARFSGCEALEYGRTFSVKRTITVTELRRHFGRILREVEEGQWFVLTRWGRPAALLAPAVDTAGIPEEEGSPR